MRGADEAAVLGTRRRPCWERVGAVFGERLRTVTLELKLSRQRVPKTTMVLAADEIMPLLLQAA